MVRPAALDLETVARLGRTAAFLVCVSLLLTAPSFLAAQVQAFPPDTGRALLLEHRFGPDSAASIVVTLERRGIYWVEFTGPGLPVFQPVLRRPHPAVLLLISEDRSGESRRFELHVIHTGPHRVSLPDVPAGTSATLRLYEDVLVSRQISQKLKRQLVIGLRVAGGFHSGYRLDPNGGADPAGGSDLEGCLVAETGDRFDTCIGGGRQSFPDAGFGTAWLFIEQGARLVSAHVLGAHRIDVGATLRYSEALNAGPRHISPGLLGFGLQVTQHLTTDGGVRGLRIFCAWQHGRLRGAPETELLDSEHFTAGVLWIL
jgi:hypothetical protein